MNTLGPSEHHVGNERIRLPVDHLPASLWFIATLVEISGATEPKPWICGKSGIFPEGLFLSNFGHQPLFARAKGKNR